MSRLTWDSPGERRYETGVDRGVFYPQIGGIYTNGIAWNGLTGVDDEIGGREATPLYSGDIKMASEYTPEEYSGSIRCYTYPDEFEEYLGETEVLPGLYARQQERGFFGFSYRSLIGNDAEGIEHGYKLHLVYNMRVSDFSRSYATVNDSNEIQETQIAFDSFPQEVSDEDIDPMSELILDSRLVDPELLEAIEDILYGEDGAPRLPYPDEIMEIEALLRERTYSYVFSVSAATIPSGASTGGAQRMQSPVIPLDATIRRIVVENTPSEYAGILSFSGSLDDSRTTISYSVRNTTEEAVTISDSFDITVAVYYLESES